MSKAKRKRGDSAKDSLDQFEAYGEYTYAYQHPSQPEDEGWEQELTENGSTSRLPRRSPRIPLEKEAPRKRSHSLLGRLIFLLVCAVVALLVLQGTVFRLKTVYVVGNKTKTPQQITEASGLVQGLNIFAINEAEIRRNLASDHTLELKGIQKEYPSTIYLYVRERAHVAAFQWLGIQYMLDEQGLVMEESNSLLLPEGIPVVTGFQISNIRVGQPLEVKEQKQLSAYQSIMMELGLQLYISQISELNLTVPDNLYLMTVDGITIRLGNGQHIRAKIGALRTDMAYLRQLGKTSGILDVSIPEDAKYTPER